MRTKEELEEMFDKLLDHALETSPLDPEEAMAIGSIANALAVRINGM